MSKTQLPVKPRENNNLKKPTGPSLSAGVELLCPKSLPVVRGHAYHDDHWLVNCPSCGKGSQWTGFFDSGDKYKCELCGTEFRCERIVFDDDSYIT